MTEPHQHPPASTPVVPKPNVNWLFFDPTNNPDSLVFRSVLHYQTPGDVAAGDLPWTAYICARFNFQVNVSTLRFWQVNINKLSAKTLPSETFQSRLSLCL